MRAHRLLEEGIQLVGLDRSPAATAAGRTRLECVFLERQCLEQLDERIHVDDARLELEPSELQLTLEVVLEQHAVVRHHHERIMDVVLVVHHRKTIFDGADGIRPEIELHIAQLFDGSHVHLGHHHAQRVGLALGALVGVKVQGHDSR